MMKRIHAKQALLLNLALVNIIVYWGFLLFLNNIYILEFSYSYTVRFKLNQPLIGSYKIPVAFTFQLKSDEAKDTDAMKSFSIAREFVSFCINTFVVKSSVIILCFIMVNLNNSPIFLFFTLYLQK